MVDTIYVLNGSRKLDKRLPLEVITELNSIRPVDAQEMGNADVFLDRVVGEVFEPQRRQVHFVRLLEKINAAQLLNSLRREGKFIVVDADLYSDSASNWCFGGFCPTEYGLGYLMVSAARFEDDVLARQVLRHEFGHLFGAPSKGRSNTVEELGLHCTTDLCTMQQKLSVAEAKKSALQIEKAGSFPYCPQCTEDIQRYRPPE